MPTDTLQTLADELRNGADRDTIAARMRTLDDANATIADRLRQWHDELAATPTGRFIAAEVARRFPEIGTMRASQEFKVNDRVRIARVDSSAIEWVAEMDATLDREGIITNYDPHDGTFRVRVDSARRSNDAWWYGPACLEHV